MQQQKSVEKCRTRKCQSELHSTLTFHVITMAHARNKMDAAVCFTAISVKSFVLAHAMSASTGFLVANAAAVIVERTAARASWLIVSAILTFAGVVRHARVKTLLIR
jgi:branched-subunit amino acid transport protein